MELKQAIRTTPTMGKFNFEEVYRDNIAYLWRTLQRLGVPAADLEDRAHDVFSIVHRKQDSFERGRTIRPWLFGIAFRVASDARKRARHRETYQLGQEPPDSNLPHDQLSTQRQIVMAGLAGLSLEQRAVVVMHDLDGYTAPEIAGELQIALNTVYSRLRLGRARFVMAVRAVDRGEDYYE
ncbi:MAG: RNA polymerase sigma factor [Kofleriaceae bacterium]|nr:RNA polymerase sigma factor [Kofleriaceae bacterium]